MQSLGRDPATIAIPYPGNSTHYSSPRYPSADSIYGVRKASRAFGIIVRYVDERRDMSSRKSAGDFHIAETAPDDFAWVLQSGRVVRRILRLILKELFSPVPIPFSRALWGWRRGFGKMANLVYQLDKSGPENYISEFRHALKCTRINGHYDHLLNNKLLLPLLTKALDLEGPAQLAFSRSGVVHDGRGGQLGNLEAWLHELLERCGTIVIKPVKGRKGQGLAFVRQSGGQLTINEVPAEVSEVVSFLQTANDSVVTRFVSQTEYARNLYPRTPNTIRMLTIWDYQEGEPFVAAAAQRIGSKRSYPADNFLAGRGGLSAEINLESGRLGQGATLTDAWELVRHDTHPETGSQIEGVVIPGWSDTCRKILRAAKMLSWTPQIAWDLLIADSGVNVIEVNGSPGLPVHQVHGPLLRDSRYWNFYRTHGVVS